MVQAARRRPLNAKTLLAPGPVQLRIVVNNISPELRFYTRISVSPNSTIPPALHTRPHLNTVRVRTSGQRLGNWTKHCSFRLQQRSTVALSLSIFERLNVTHETPCVKIMSVSSDKLFRQYSQPIMARTWHVSRATITLFFLSFIPFFASLKCVTSKERIGLPLSASDGAVSNIYSPPVSTRGKLYVPVETTRGHNAQSNYKPTPIAQCKYIKWKKTADCNLRQNLRITQCPSTFLVFLPCTSQGSLQDKALKRAANQFHFTVRTRQLSFTSP